jgi:selenide, water dikinase
LSRPRDPRLLVGFDTADDAGVVALDPQRALIQTVDFFTPVVDDPYLYGQIAAANALSDVYAMGGDVLCAMNILGVPEKVLTVEVIATILSGGADKLAEAGGMLVGGHTVKAPEPFYGMSVTGLVHPDRIWRNVGARAGDGLVLTKPLGTGILTTARKRDAIADEALAPAIASMIRLNRDAARVAQGFVISACTDITGNGLAGHAWEVARASGVRLVFRFAALPLLPGALEHASRHCPGGAEANARYVGEGLQITASDGDARAVALDPQTSGGLLFSTPEADALVVALRAAGIDAHRVGDVEPGPSAVIVD